MPLKFFATFLIGDEFFQNKKFVFFYFFEDLNMSISPTVNDLSKTKFTGIEILSKIS